MGDQSGDWLRRGMRESGGDEIVSFFFIKILFIYV